ncbi:unnamed protein product [Choristocarpus tenellus]
MGLPLATRVARAGRKKISPLFADKGALSSVYEVVCVLVNTITVNYLVIPFQMLSWENSIAVWSRFYFAIHVGMVIVYMVCSVLPEGKNGHGSKTKAA